MSRWVMPLRWASRRPSAADRMIESASSTGSGPRGHARGERLAGDILHREVQPAGFLPDEVDVADVRVGDPGLRPRLADHALATHRIAGDRGGQHLDRDRPLEREIGREVDLAHASGAERPPGERLFSLRTVAMSILQG